MARSYRPGILPILTLEGQVAHTQLNAVTSRSVSVVPRAHARRQFYENQV